MRKPADKINIVMLPSDFNLAALESVVPQVTSYVESGDTFQIDGSEVEQTDCAAIQFLVACNKHRAGNPASDSDHPLISAASEVLLDSMQQVGGQGFFNFSAFNGDKQKQSKA